MSEPLSILPYTPSPTHDIEMSPSVPEKKMPPPSVFSRQASTLNNASSTLLPIATSGVEGPPPVPKTERRTLSSVFSWAVGLLSDHPFFLSTAIAVFLAGSVAGIVHWSYNRNADPSNKLNFNGIGIGLIGHNHRLDLIDRKLSIGWEIWGCGRDYVLQDVSNLCDVLGIPVDIYFSGASKPTFSYDPALFPFSEDLAEPLALNSLQVFEVNHSIDYPLPDMVPFDTYEFFTSVFVINKGTNESVPIVTFAAGEVADNFLLTSKELRTMNNFTYDSGTEQKSVNVESRVIRIEAKRSQLAKAFTICLLLINWALAIVSIHITLLVLQKKKVATAILALPVTIVITIPTLRGLYVGSPPFGIYIDTFGFFLQMMVVAVSSMVLLYTSLKHCTSNH